MHACFIGEKLDDASVFTASNVLMMYDDESSDGDDIFSDNEDISDFDMS